MQKMSVTRALAELKRIDERIQRDIYASTFVGVTVGRESNRKMASGNDTPEKVAANIQSSVDSLDALMSQRAKIKAAIVASNAKTLVTVGNREMTVAEAIELKSTVSTKSTLVSVMKSQLNNANTDVQALNAKLDAQIEQNLTTIYGSEKSKIDSTTYDLVAKPQRNLKEAALLDPMKIADKIKALEDEISLIKTELDYALSEVNAKTEIEV